MRISIGTWYEPCFAVEMSKTVISANISAKQSTRAVSVRLLDSLSFTVSSSLLQGDDYLKGRLNSFVNLCVHTFPVRPSVLAESSQVDFKDGGRLVLSCRAEGHPPPEISWSFNDVPIPRGENMQIGSSRITILDEYMVTVFLNTPWPWPQSNCCYPTNLKQNSI